MSKHFFRATSEAKDLHVDVGWDRPLRHYYLNIERASPPEDEDLLLYASLYDTHTYAPSRANFMGGLTLQEVQERFARFHITPPDGLLAALEDDAYTNAGNAITHW